MTTTFDRIQQLSNERFALWRKAGKDSLMPDEFRRLSEINGELPRLWDQYRSELAAQHHHRRAA